MGLNIEGLESYRSSQIYGHTKVASFLSRIEQSFVNAEPESKKRVVLLLAGESLSGKTRFWLKALEHLRRNVFLKAGYIFGTDVLLWVDGIYAARDRANLIDPRRKLGELRGYEFEGVSGLYEHGLKEALTLDYLDSPQNRLEIAESPFFTAAIIDPPVNPNIEGHIHLGRLMIGKDRAFSVAYDLAHKNPPFDLNCEIFLAALSADSPSRERGFQDRLKMELIQTEEGMRHFLDQHGYDYDESWPQLTLRSRLGGTTTAVLSVAEHTNELIVLLNSLGFLEIPGRNKNITKEELNRYPTFRAKVIRNLLHPLMARDILTLDPDHVFIGYLKGRDDNETSRRSTQPLLKYNFLDKLYHLEENIQVAERFRPRLSTP